MLSSHLYIHVIDLSKIKDCRRITTKYIKFALLVPLSGEEYTGSSLGTSRAYPPVVEAVTQNVGFYSSEE